MNKITKALEHEKGQESPMSINQKKIQNEMIHFKEEILKEMKNFERNLSEKFISSNRLLDERLDSFEKRIETNNQRIFNLSDKIVDDRMLKEKVEKITIDNLDIKNNMILFGAKLDKLSKEFDEKILYIENILNDSVIYQGIIGSKCKFINFHEFIDYVLAQLSKYFIVSTKNTNEINSFKTKLQSSINNIQMQFDGILKSANLFTKKSVFEFENKIKDIAKITEFDLSQMKTENEKQMNNMEQLINNTKKEIINEIDNGKIQSKEENDKLKLLISRFEKQINELKESYNKLDEEIKEIDEKIISEEFQKNTKQDIIKSNGSRNNFHIDENEMANKFLRGEMNEEQFLIYKQFNKLNLMLTNLLEYFLEKSTQIMTEKKTKKFRKTSSINFASQISSCFNNIISEIAIERTKRRTVNNLLHCINLKLNKEDDKEQNKSVMNIRKNISDIDLKTPNLNNKDIKVATSENINNDLRYISFSIDNKKKHLRLINSADSRNIINENSQSNEKNTIKDLEEKILQNNIIIERENNGNENIRKIKEYSNKISHVIKNKIVINRTSKIKQDLINGMLQHSLDNENMNLSQRKILKDKININIIPKIANKKVIEEESKQSKLNKTVNTKIEPENNTISITAFKSFKGKKYLGYEKSFDAKVKEKLISYDIDYKDKMKKIREGIHRDISFVPPGNLPLPKNMQSKEVEALHRMVNSLQSYVGENSYKNKNIFRKNNINDSNKSDNKLRENLFNKNNFG
jgi:hypothetical protein